MDYSTNNINKFKSSNHNCVLLETSSNQMKRRMIDTYEQSPPTLFPIGILPDMATSAFTSFERNINGYHCRYLNEESVMLFKIIVKNMIITHTKHICLFDMRDDDRITCWEKTEQLLQRCRRPGTDSINPFDSVKVSSKPVLLRTSSTCMYYCIRYDEFHRCNDGRNQRPPNDVMFTGKLAITIKGVKYTRNALEVSPIMSVTQVLELPRPMSWALLAKDEQQLGHYMNAH